MVVTSVPPALRDRIGHDGALALLEMREDERVDWRDEVIAVVTDRFECRLTAEMAALRQTLHEGMQDIRQELAATRLDMLKTRFDVLKWSVAFWTANAAMIVALFTLLGRGRL